MKEEHELRQTFPMKYHDNIMGMVLLIFKLPFRMSHIHVPYDGNFYVTRS